MHIEFVFRAEMSLFLDSLIYSRGFSCLIHSRLPLNVGPFWNGFSNPACLKLISLSSFSIKQLLLFDVPACVGGSPSLGISTALTLPCPPQPVRYPVFSFTPFLPLHLVPLVHLNSALTPPSHSTTGASNGLPGIYTLCTCGCPGIWNTLLDWPGLSLLPSVGRPVGY